MSKSEIIKAAEELAKWHELYAGKADGLSLSGIGKHEGYARIIRSLIALVPGEGMVVVPEEPTEKMLNAARDWSDKKYGKPIGNDAAIGCYKALLKAAKEEK